MNFKFYPNESRLYDFLQFPGLVYFREVDEKLEEDNSLKDLCTKSYLDFVKKAEDRLMSFKNDIEIFYNKEYLSKYNFIDQIFKINNIFNYKDEKSYLDMLLNLNEEEINRSIIYSIITSQEEYNTYSEEAMKRAEEISTDKNEIISFIKNLPTEASIKWNLFLIVEEPVKYMKKYVDLMNRILPMFKDLYSSFEDEINDYGRDLVDYLNKNGPKGLDDITCSIVDAKVLDEKENNIFISVVSSYTIRIMSTTKKPYVAWGLKMEEAFKKIKEINENKVNERVQIFKNLGDKTRYEVVKLIASGKTSTKEIAETLGVTSATISYHINNLVTSKIIKLDKTENRYGYIVDYDLLEDCIDSLKEDLIFSKYKAGEQNDEF